jgi:hypothetical protein
LLIQIVYQVVDPMFLRLHLFGILVNLFLDFILKLFKLLLLLTDLFSVF